MDEVEVYLEVVEKLTFACAYAWPGWARSAKTEEAALRALVDYAPRYAPVPESAGIDFRVEPSVHLRVVARLPGDATTAFGAPSQILPADLEQPSEVERDRLLGLLAASWNFFDHVVADSPESLRKGPRGGGRDRTKIVDHVLGAEAGYSRLLGLKLGQPEPGDAGALIAHRQALLDALRTDRPAAAGQGRRWPMRYAIRRLAWHVLDHAWEIQDRRDP